MKKNGHLHLAFDMEFIAGYTLTSVILMFTDFFFVMWILIVDHDDDTIKKPTRVL